MKGFKTFTLELMTRRIESERLARLFDETWNSLPDAERDILKNRIVTIHDGRAGLATNHHLPPPDGVEILAQAQPIVPDIYNIWLNPELEKETDHMIKSVIAHELGHVFWNHGHQPPVGVDPNDPHEVKDAAEYEADMFAENWGYEKVDWVFNQKMLADAYLAQENAKPKRKTRAKQANR